MAHISGTFSHAKAGRIRVAFSGTFEYGTYRDAGFPYGDADNASSVNIVVRPYVGPVGSRVYGEPIDRYAPAVVFEVDYPGGNVSWPVGSEEVAHVHPTGGGGIWTYGMRNLKFYLRFTKR